MRFVLGILLAVAGAALDFWPIGSVTSGTPPSISFWQAHDLCSSGLGQLGQFLSGGAASSCSTVTLVWLGGLGLMVIGGMFALSGLFGTGRSSPATRDDSPRTPLSAPPPFAPSPAPVLDETSAPSPSDTAPSGPRPDARRPRRLALAVSALFFVLVGVVAVFAWGPLAGQPVVPVFACATTYGYEGAATASLPPTVAEPFLTASSASQLARYVTADGTYSQLAPRGWICTGSEGADGSWGLTIHPLTDPSATVTLDGAFNGPGTDMAAPLFPVAHDGCLAQFAGTDTTLMCPSPPPSEVIDRKSSGLVFFSDPPGTTGSSEISGVYSVLGAMQFLPPDHATRVACALPESSRSLCEVIVDAVTASWAGQK